MPRRRPLAPLTLTDEQQDQLNGIAQSATPALPACGESRGSGLAPARSSFVH